MQLHSGLPAGSQTAIGLCMKRSFSTREAAKKLGVALITPQRHVSSKTVEAPKLQNFGGARVRLWTERDIEAARKVLAQIRPGRKKKAQGFEGQT
jgi:hypothetical protein